MGIKFEYKEKDMKEVHGRTETRGNTDYNKKTELKKEIKNIFKNYECPNCGGHRVNGDGVVVEIGRVRFFREVKKKGMFGTKYVDKHDRDVYRIYTIYLESDGFLSAAGYLRCKSCKWEQKGKKKTQVKLRIDSLNNASVESEEPVLAHSGDDIQKSEKEITEIEGIIRDVQESVRLEANVVGHSIRGVRNALTFIPVFETVTTPKPVEPKRITVLSFLIEPSANLSSFPYSVVSAEMAGKKINGIIREGDKVVVTGKMEKSRHVFIVTEIQSLSSGERITPS